MTTGKAKTFSRRTVLKGAAATGGLALGSGAVSGFPTIWAQNIKDVTLRQFGTGVSNLNEVAAKVKEDLGFTLEMTALDSDSVAQRAATQPNSFDIADIEYWICKKVWPAGNLQAMDTSKIKNYDKIVGRIQERYGETKEKAAETLNRFLDKFRERRPRPPTERAGS